MGLVGVDPLIEVNVGIWGFILPMLGIFSFVRFKRGGPYGPGGTYISDVEALILLLTTALLSHFVLSPILRRSIELVCVLNPYMKHFLLILGLLITWMFIKRSRKRK